MKTIKLFFIVILIVMTSCQKILQQDTAVLSEQTQAIVDFFLEENKKELCDDKQIVITGGYIDLLVTCVAPIQTDCKFSSQTGTMYYGKAMDGTYFVEKQFSEEQQGLPSGILLFMISSDYYEEVLLRLIALRNLPLELLNH